MDKQNKKPVGFIVRKLDNFQQKHYVAGFIYAVIKKYSDDEAAYEGALITYYGFLSLFPLLIVLTSFLQIILRSHETLHHRIITSLAQYFPVLGNEIEHGLHEPKKSGLALIASLLFMLYGARGGADAFRHAMNKLWYVPKSKRPNFPDSIFVSLKIIITAAVGLFLATSLSSVATSLGHSIIFRILAILVSVTILYGLFIVLFKWATSKRYGYKSYRFSALAAAVGIQILQTAGGFIITHELKNLTTLYGAFALVLGILFWIYLQAQIVLYAVEAGVVRKLKLWPRSITRNPMTAQDEKAYELYVRQKLN